MFECPNLREKYRNCTMQQRTNTKGYAEILVRFVRDLYDLESTEYLDQHQQKVYYSEGKNEGIHDIGFNLLLELSYWQISVFILPKPS